MTEPGGEFFEPEPQPNKAELYTKPTFPFYQEEFTEPKEISEDERLGVLSIIERTTDRILDDAEAEGDRGEDGPNRLVIMPNGEEGVIEEVYLDASDGRPASLSIFRRNDGVVTERGLTIYWIADERKIPDSGRSTYGVDYLTVKPTVTRDDDNNQPLPLGYPDNDKSAFAKRDAHHAAKEAGFNDQPVGLREIQELQDYLGTPH